SHQGRIVNASSPGTKRLGERLLEAGAIGPPTLGEALRKQGEEHPRRSLGQILVAMKAVDSDTIYRTIEQQIERTVYDLVTWNQGTFHFALDDLKPIDDIAVFPGDVIRHLNLDTQMVLLDALRIFDERNRDAGMVERAGPEPSQPPPTMPESPAAPEPSEPAPEEAPLPVRLEVISADKQLADKLEHAATGAAVVRVSLRDAGLPAAGEQPPIVLVDMRHDAVAPEALANLRASRPLAT